MIVSLSKSRRNHTKLQSEVYKGTIYIKCRNSKVIICASLDMKQFCKDALGPPNHIPNSTYDEWHNVNAHQIAHVIGELARTAE